MSSNGDDYLSSYDLLLDGELVVLDDSVGLEALKSTTISSNISGTVIVTGTKDGLLRSVDFSKWMSGGFGPSWTKSLEQSISSVAISNDESILAVACGNILNFYTDGGDFVVNTTKGDMYLLDAKKTKGHTAMITNVIPDVIQYNMFISSSIDGTIRIFDLDSNREGVSLTVNWKKIYLPKASRGARIPIYSICNSLINGKSHIIGGNERGGLVVWDYRMCNVSSACLDSHMSNINCILSPQDSKLISRSDSSIKLWDLRNFKTCLKEIFIEGGDYCSQCMTLSPDSLHVAISEQLPINPRNIKEGFKGSIKIVKSEDLTLVETQRLKSPPGPLTWARDTTQLFTVALDGLIYAKCPNKISGALYASRAKKSKSKRDKYSSIQNISAHVESYPIDFLPNDLEETDDGTLRKKRVKKQYDKKGAQSEPDVDTITMGKTPITYDDDDDIVKRLRSMQGDGIDVNQSVEYGGIQKIPYKVDKFMAMYKKTQPDVILDFSKPDPNSDNRLLGVNKCPRCGLKICQCGFMKE